MAKSVFWTKNVNPKLFHGLGFFDEKQIFDAWPPSIAVVCVVAAVVGFVVVAAGVSADVAVVVAIAVYVLVVVIVAADVVVVKSNPSPAILFISPLVFSIQHKMKKLTSFQSICYVF